MPDYNYTRFYKLINTETDDVYIGCTTQTLAQRMGGHRADAKRNEDYFMNILGIDKWRIVLIKIHKCKNKDDASATEQKYIDRFKPFFNKLNVIPKNPIKAGYMKKYNATEKGRIANKNSHAVLVAKRKNLE